MGLRNILLESDSIQVASYPSLDGSILLVFIIHVATTAREQHATNNSAINVNKWGKLATREFKCNVDATIFYRDTGYGIGMCIRDEEGHFVKAKHRIVVIRNK
ncbi:hypothetical protein TSUD_277590 [Trifolium subterraneum]|uniref:RNase H type-1 domain-containing protein n=1 Tax=Trifolium subterraneum TaxID=3900 RepID=A0A2Z6N387_TRISU|nr:hypothetical protein TSUD_277590 [Trifolium subterraneum]